MPGWDISGRAIEEVRALHAFFVAWFRNDTAQKTDFSRCDAVLAADFRMVAPDGEIHSRAKVVERLHAARGRAASDFSIEILQPHVVWHTDDAVLLEYIEQQYRGGGKVTRRSTCLFTSDPAAPQGVVWRHLQETWIHSGEGPKGGAR